jgi:hypothetical protein
MTAGQAFGAVAASKGGRRCAGLPPLTTGEITVKYRRPVRRYRWAGATPAEAATTLATARTSARSTLFRSHRDPPPDS